MRYLFANFCTAFSFSFACTQSFELAWLSALLAVVALIWPKKEKPKTGDGTFTVPPGITHLHVKMVGAGGGGGGNDEMLALNPDGSLKVNSARLLGTDKAKKPRERRKSPDYVIVAKPSKPSFSKKSIEKMMRASKRSKS